MEFKGTILTVTDFFPDPELEIRFDLGKATDTEEARHELTLLMLKGRKVLVTVEPMEY